MIDAPSEEKAMMQMTNNEKIYQIRHLFQNILIRNRFEFNMEIESDGNNFMDSKALKYYLNQN